MPPPPGCWRSTSPPPSDQGVEARQLQGTTQNDIIKEYLSRGTYVFPPEPSMRLISDMIAYTVDAIPKWNPINICSYHLQEAGATPEQEIAYAMANAIAVLDAVRARGDLPADALPRVVGRISFFLNAGIRFVEETCKCRAMAELWDEITRERYGVEDPKLRRFRYGVQVNSLGLTESAAREQRDPHRARGARRHALEERALPGAAAAGLERGAGPAALLGPAVVAAHAADPRLRDRPARVRGPVRRLAVIERRCRSLEATAREELDRVLAMGGAVAAVENAYMKRRLVESQTARLRAIEKARSWSA
jgi:ethylmalonyl-CoA mutase